MLLTDFIGPAYGSETFSLFLYSMVKLHAPKKIVELGTGLGASAFWMALAAKENGVGHVWSVDDLGTFRRHSDLLEKTIVHLEEAGIASLKDITEVQFFSKLAQALHVDERVTFITRQMNLDEVGHFDSYPFEAKHIDLLFSDFMHGPIDVLNILAHFLPKMSPASSIFLDSASTLWTSYLLIEQLVSQLNAGKIPNALQERCTTDLLPILQNRRIVLVHLTEARRYKQNSTTWLKLEPTDVFPQPFANMRM